MPSSRPRANGMNSHGFSEKRRPRVVSSRRGKIGRLAVFTATLPARSCTRMDAWTIGLFAVAALVAIGSLARLMLARRDRLLAELSAEAREEQRKKQLADAEQKKKQKKQVA